MRCAIVFLCLSAMFGQAACSKSKPAALGVREVLEAFKAAGLPIDNEIIYTDDSDPNKLHGRPHQYIAKANWADRRIEQSSGEIKGGTIEAFDSRESLERRKKYIDEIGEAIPLYLQYQLVHKNILLRLEKDLTPNQAAEYERVLKNL